MKKGLRAESYGVVSVIGALYQPRNLIITVGCPVRKAKSFSSGYHPETSRGTGKKCNKQTRARTWRPGRDAYTARPLPGPQKQAVNVRILQIMPLPLGSVILRAYYDIHSAQTRDGCFGDREQSPYLETNGF